MIILICIFSVIISEKVKADNVDKVIKANKIEYINDELNKNRIIPLTKKQIDKLVDKEMKLINNKNNKYEKELKNYDKEIQKLNTKYKFPYDNKYIKPKLINTKSALDNRFIKMKKDKSAVDEAFTQFNDKTKNVIDIKIPDVDEKLLKDKVNELKDKLHTESEELEKTAKAIQGCKTAEEVNKIDINNFRPYQINRLKEVKKDQLANIEYRKIQAQKANAKAEKAKPKPKQNTQSTAAEPLVPYSISINGKTYPIYEGGQSEVDLRSQAWISDHAHLVDYRRKKANEDFSLWVSAHRDVGAVIENVDEIIFMDDNGNTAKYVKLGLTRLIDANYLVDEDDEIWPLMDGTAGDYITLQTCIDYSGRYLAYGHVFGREQC